MDWVERMNAVMAYVEEHVAQEIAECEISRIALCPYAVFQAQFCGIAGIPFSEYVRRRRLGLAAHEVISTDARILDIALRYGYQSADAFSVAFKRMHGVPPAAARKPGVPLTFFCRLHFALKVEGVESMEYTKMEKPPFTVMGVRRTTPYGGGTWAVVKSDGSSETFSALTGKFFDLGLCFGFHEDGSNDYMCAIEWEGAVPEGYDGYTYPAATWLRFVSKGRISEGALYLAWKHINEEFLPQSKYKKAGLPTIERYRVWNEESDACEVEILIPVALK